MTKETKKIFHKELIALLLKDVKDDNDTEFFNRLLYALNIISTELNYFEENI